MVARLTRGQRRAARRAAWRRERMPSGAGQRQAEIAFDLARAAVKHVTPGKQTAAWRLLTRKITEATSGVAEMTESNRSQFTVHKPQSR